MENVKDNDQAKYRVQPSLVSRKTFTTKDLQERTIHENFLNKIVLAKFTHEKNEIKVLFF